MVRVFIQARMSSSRFPGKVLAPLAGRPLISHVIERVAQAFPRERIVVATSTDPTDEPLASYLSTLGVSVFRGPLEDVFSRFRLCVGEYPCEWFFRICGDSPLFDPQIAQAMLPHAETTGIDLITNVQRRTFPPGLSVELVRSSRFAAIDASRLTPEDREHVTRFYYRHPHEFNILNFENGNASALGDRVVVDTVDDLRRIELRLLKGEAPPDLRLVLQGER